MRINTRKYLSLCWLGFQSVPTEKISVNGVFQPSAVDYENCNTERILTLSMPTYYNSKTCFCYAHSNAAYSLNFELRTYEIFSLLL
jgi:hypothetical protein